MSWIGKVMRCKAKGHISPAPCYDTIMPSASMSLITSAMNLPPSWQMLRLSSSRSKSSRSLRSGSRSRRKVQLSARLSWLISRSSFSKVPRVDTIILVLPCPVLTWCCLVSPLLIILPLLCLPIILHYLVLSCSLPPNHLMATCKFFLFSN